MKKIKPKNPMHIIFCSLIPWRIKNTYYSIDGDNLIISRYFLQNETAKMKHKIDCINLKKLHSFGFPRDLKTNMIEPVIISGAGVYVSQEIQFLLNDKTIIPWNVRPYSKKQIITLSKYIFDNYSIKPGKYLGKAIKFEK